MTFRSLGLGLICFLACNQTADAAKEGDAGPSVDHESASTPTASPAESNTCDAIGKVTRVCGPGGLGWGNHASIEGRGLEFRHFKLKTKGALPPAPGTILDAQPNLVEEGCPKGALQKPPLSVKIRKCASESKQAYRCVVDVVSEGAGICNQVDRHGYAEEREQTKKERGVVLLSGYWDKTGTWINKPDTVTLSCDASGGWDQALSADGALTACLQLWHYDPRHHREELLSCVRALRADYCGDGTSRTLQGTDLDLHDKSSNLMTTEQCVEKRALEASWSPAGAVCFAHARYAKGGIDDESCNKLFGPPDANGVRCRLRPDPEILFTRSRCNVCSMGRWVDQDCPPDTDPICKGLDKPALPRKKPEPK